MFLFETVKSSFSKRWECRTWDYLSGSFFSALLNKKKGEKWTGRFKFDFTAGDNLIAKQACQMAYVTPVLQMYEWKLENS